MLIDAEPVVGIWSNIGLKPEDCWYRAEAGVFHTHINGRDHFPDFEHFPDFDNYRQSYGVCDNVEQVKQKYPELVTGDRKFVVLLSEIRHEDETEQNWRWHKWGEYIGTHEPQHEYLYDEVGIERVLVFSIIEQN